MIKINGREIEFITFPNGEISINQDSFMNALDFGVTVQFHYTNDSDLIKLMFVKRYLDDVQLGHPNHLIITYMPYSRMDRSENESPFTLKYVAEFINNLGFQSIEVVEPHSDVTCALLDRAKPYYINFELVEEVKKLTDFDEENDYLVFPDSGASKRYAKMKANRVLVGHKHRDFQTGQILNLQMVGHVHSTGRNAIIVDDLSSFGGTFIQTSKALKKLGFKKVYLLVAHSENSIFKTNKRTGEQLFDYIDKVFTTDSILTDENNWENAKFGKQLHIFQIEG